MNFAKSTAIVAAVIFAMSWIVNHLTKRGDAKGIDESKKTAMLISRIIVVVGILYLFSAFSAYSVVAGIAVETLLTKLYALYS